MHRRREREMAVDDGCNELPAHKLGTDENGRALYSPESAPALDARGVAYWADEDGLLHEATP